jgi:DNA-binding HxlR family transcriptional regulator
MKKEKDCPLQVISKIIGGKWKLLIMLHLLDGTKRFNELRRLIPDVTQRMLTNQLRELEKEGIITRKIYAQVPPKVEYSLSDIGKNLKPAFDQLRSWGITYLKKKK